MTGSVDSLSIDIAMMETDRPNEHEQHAILTRTTTTTTTVTKIGPRGIEVFFFLVYYAWSNIRRG